MGLSDIVENVIRWMRAGYPEGIPATDCVPLFALLSQRLTEDEIEDFAAELAEASDADTAKAIHEAAVDRTDHHPTDAELARVRARLEAGGADL